MSIIMAYNGVINGEEIMAASISIIINNGENGKIENNENGVKIINVNNEMA
jgi:hypothetical protein